MEAVERRGTGVMSNAYRVSKIRVFTYVSGLSCLIGRLRSVGGRGSLYFWAFFSRTRKKERKKERKFEKIYITTRNNRCVPFGGEVVSWTGWEEKVLYCVQLANMFAAWTGSARCSLSDRQSMEDIPSL